MPGDNQRQVEATQPAFMSMLEQEEFPKPANSLLAFIKSEGVKKRRSGKPKATAAEHAAMRQDRGGGRQDLIVLPTDGE